MLANEPMKLEKGGVYVIQYFGGRMTQEQWDKLRTLLTAEEERLGLQLLLLPQEAQIVRVNHEPVALP